MKSLTSPQENGQASLNMQLAKKTQALKAKKSGFIFSKQVLPSFRYLFNLKISDTIKQKTNSNVISRLFPSNNLKKVFKFLET